MPTYYIEDCPCCDSVTVSCCDDPVKTTLYASIELDYFAIPGSPDYTLSFTLVYNATDEVWIGSTTCEDESITLRIWCSGGGWHWSVECALGYALTDSNLPVSACSPFLAGGTSGSLDSICCGRDDRPFSLSATITVSE